MKTFLAILFTFFSLSLFSQTDPPEAVDDFAETHAGIAVTINPVGNDIPNCADTLVIFAYPVPKKGKILEKTDSFFTYIPFNNASGIDSIRYFVGDKNNFACYAEGRVYVDITNQHYYDSLEINNINAGVNASGYLFSRIEEVPSMNIVGDQRPHFHYPEGFHNNTIFNTSLWIGGLDANDSLHLAAQRYKQVGFDYRSGPVSDNYDEGHFLKYGRTWKINREEVEYHRNNYWKEGYEPIEPIASWPGNGDPDQGEALQLAPYHDEDGDGFYDPMQGDYPLIRGDQTVFFIYNDDRDHTETQGESMGVEIHVMVYGYDVPEDSALYNTVFVHYDFYNRSPDNYHETYIGCFTDFNLGYPWDEFIASDVERGSFYVYNGEEVDGNGEPGSYGENPPAQSVTILAGPFMDPDGEDNPDGGCDESVNGLNFGNGIIDDERHGLTSFIYFAGGGGTYHTDPTIASEYYTYEMGLWKDATPLMYGGNGHPLSGAVGPACRFMFPGASDPGNWGSGCEYPNDGYNQDGKYWTEEEAGNIPYDRRGLGATGPFSFAPGDVQEVELAFVIGRGEDGPLSSVEQMKQQIDTLIDRVHNGKVIVTNEYLAVDEAKVMDSQVIIYPNPAKDVVHIKTGMNVSGEMYWIYNMQGQVVGSGELNASGNSIINLRSLPKGLYLFVVQTRQQLLSGRVVKN